jgi:hypothetical protein
VRRRHCTIPGLNALKAAYRQGRVVAMPFLVNHLVEYGYLTLQEELSSLIDDSGNTETITEAVYAISGKGRRLLDGWRLK